MSKIGQTTPPLPEIVGNSAAMQEVYKLVRLAAPRSANVLLVGETGTGKEVIARAIHKLSRRSDGPYIRVNCGALHENLLESELFGHVKGAFTGAIENKSGRFEAAHGGTIFLDEINSMSSQLQVKLLRVLQEREFEKVGESRTIRVDVRVVAATNKRLEALVESGQFREDLYYRLNVVPIVLPPLVERAGDIPLLAEFFLKKYIKLNQMPDEMSLEEELIEALKKHSWPGNVRELENAIERMVVLSENGRLAVEYLEMKNICASSSATSTSTSDFPALVRQLVRVGLATPLTAEQKLADFVVGGVERELIEQVLRQCDQVQVKAAARLGINRNTLHKKISEYEQSSLTSGS